MNHRDLITEVRAKPGLFGLDGSYRSSVAFLVGLDLGSSGGLLRGFSEWLVVRRGHRTSLGWQRLVLEVALAGESISGPADLDGAREQRSVDFLFALLIEFLELRDNSLEFARMYAAYSSLYASDE
ncbi:hypothetical protein ABZW03_10505 [Kitasatospora sp. NPDC004799]|uniref:hypothetical protein n=1 Tax=Kitasatospora sp. NPDC004799 TaxID=3154460 RepID=UPI0033A8BCD3